MSVAPLTRREAILGSLLGEALTLRPEGPFLSVQAWAWGIVGMGSSA